MTFKKGDRVRVPDDCPDILEEFLGMTGVITGVDKSVCSVSFDRVPEKWDRPHDGIWNVLATSLVLDDTPTEFSDLREVEKFLADSH